MIRYCFRCCDSIIGVWVWLKVFGAAWENVWCFLTVELGIQSTFGTIFRVVPGTAVTASPRNLLEM